MEPTFLACFETAIGPCGVAWSGTTLRAVQLPEADAAATAARLASRHPEATAAEPEGAIAAAVAAIRALLDGAPLSLAEIAIDEEALGRFDRDVYRAARRVLPGDTSTYGAIATAIGRPAEARSVGQSLARNPFPIVVPCHRILAAGGRTGGFSGAGGVDTKLKMLTIERARITDEPGLFDTAGLPLARRPASP